MLYVFYARGWVPVFANAACHELDLHFHIFFTVIKWDCTHFAGVSFGSVFAFAAAAESLQSCLTLCDPRDSSPPGSPVPGILQARTLEWVAISFSNVWKRKVKVKSLSHVRLSDPMDCSLPGSSVHGIFQARVLEWGAITFSDSPYCWTLKMLLVFCLYKQCCTKHSSTYILVSGALISKV